jgi:hypothetical protein
VAYVVEADIFSCQDATVTVGNASTSASQAFVAPGDTSQTLIVGGAYYNQSQFAVESGGPDTSGHTLIPNGAFTSVTAQRAVAGTTATTVIQMVELGDFGGVELDPLWFGGTLW